jgi:hypothetical protein
MPESPNNADQCVTVRLPHGARDELVAATGQPFSRIVRFMVMELLSRKRAERIGRDSARVALQREIAELPSPPEDTQ